MFVREDDVVVFDLCHEDDPVVDFRRWRSIQPCELDTITTRYLAAAMTRRAPTDSGTTVVQDGAPALKMPPSPSTTCPGSGERPSASR